MGRGGTSRVMTVRLFLKMHRPIERNKQTCTSGLKTVLFIA